MEVQSAWKQAWSAWFDIKGEIPVDKKTLAQKLYAWLRSLDYFSRRRPRSIVDRIMGLILIWGFIVYLLAIAGIWIGSSKVIEDNFSYQATEWVEKLDELGTPLYASSDQEVFRSIRDHMSRFPEVSYFRYYEALDNTVIAEYFSPVPQ